MRSLWSEPAEKFHETMLLESRQQDSPARDIQNMVVENVVKPMGPVVEIAPTTGEVFNPCVFTAVGFYPSAQANDEERRRYGAELQDSYWKVRTKNGEVLASVTMAPGEDGRPRVQAMILKSEHLGAPVTEESERDRKAARTVLDMVRKGQAKELLGDVSAPSFRDRLTADAVTKSVAPLKAMLSPAAEPEFERGFRWYSIVGWVRSYEYQVPGPKGPVQVVISLREDDGLLAGLAWTGPDGQTEEL